MTAVPESPQDKAFDSERERLWALAYRICGVAADADDVVQDVWIRWDRADHAAIERPQAWLTTVTSRAAIDHLRRRRRRNRGYVGPWLPELIELEAPDPIGGFESLEIGFLLLLERLEPLERVVFLLADVFDEPFADIAATVQRSEAACRQIASRARRRVRDAQRHRPADAGEQRRLAAAFGQAITFGDLGAVVSLLGERPVLISDGGAAVRAARRPVVGAARIARFVVNLAKRASADSRIVPLSINGEPAVKVFSGERLLFAMVLHVAIPADGADASIDEIFIVRNPDKLSRLGDPAH